MDDRAIYLPWDKKFVLTSLGQTVVYGKFTEIYEYRGILVCQYPLGQTLKIVCKEGCAY